MKEFSNANIYYSIPFRCSRLFFDRFLLKIIIQT